jgi:hypothetical protein
MSYEEKLNSLVEREQKRIRVRSLLRRAKTWMALALCLDIRPTRRARALLPAPGQRQ